MPDPRQAARGLEVSRSGRWLKRAISIGFMGAWTKRRNRIAAVSDSPIRHEARLVQLAGGHDDLQLLRRRAGQQVRGLEVPLRGHGEEQLAVREPEDGLVAAEERQVVGVLCGAGAVPRRDGGRVGHVAAGDGRSTTGSSVTPTSSRMSRWFR